MKILKIFLLNIFIYTILDFGIYSLFFKNDEIQALNYQLGRYPTNYRNYFKSSKNGKFFIDRTNEVNRTYKSKNFLKSDDVIIAIGDSFTYGQGVYLEDTFIKVIEKKSNYYGVNLGHSGDDIQKAYNVLKENISKYNPDIVVYTYVYNDPIVSSDWKLSIPSKDIGAGWKEPAWDFINKRNYVLDKLYFEKTLFLKNIFPLTYLFTKKVFEKYISFKTVEYYQNIHDYNVNKAGLDESFQIIEQMSTLAKENESDFYIVIFPLLYNLGPKYPFKVVQKLLVDEISKRGINVINFLDDINNYKAHELWVHPWDQHPNDLAHSLLAKRILSEISKGN